MKLLSTIFTLSIVILGLSCNKSDVELNKVPTADAGPSKVITQPVNSVTLTGTGADSDGNIVAFLWSQVSGPSTSSIANPGSASTAINGLATGNYIFQLMVTDNEGATGVDTALITVNPSAIQTLSLQPTNNPNEKMVIQLGSSDISQQGGNEWIIDAWTSGGQNYIGRNVFRFDLSSIPANATILTANLYLYSNTPPENGNLIDANFGSNNAMLLQQITSSWTPATTNWSNQPTTTTSNQVVIPHTSQSVLDINIDVKTQVSSMVNNNANYGWLLRLQNEVNYNSRHFVSSYNASKPTKHPKLVVTYQL